MDRRNPLPRVSIVQVVQRWRLIVDCPSSLGGDVPANNALSRVGLHRILAGVAEAAGAKVTWNLTVQDLVSMDDVVEVTLTDGRSDCDDLVVGLDGIRSQLRHTVLGPRYTPTFTGYSVFRSTMPRPSEVTNALLFQGAGTKAGVIPLSEHSMYLLHVVPAPGNPHYDPARFHELLVEHLTGYRGLIGELGDSIVKPDGIVYSPLEEVLLPSPWFLGRVIVLGDAAHACAPHLTQGAAMALEDAAVLADELAVDRPVPASLRALWPVGSNGSCWSSTSPTRSSSLRWRSAPGRCSRPPNACGRHFRSNSVTSRHSSTSRADDPAVGRPPPTESSRAPC